ncbi:glycosyltransferase involved in cell wall biosynthesis [Alkalibacillus filiformis]|uniref:Glycosyltransferase involved in cell wall biosynthesis n=1 Tax=Alkalibacillus filiformis TaxID=200990 RepID=A0ABU0DWD0_9BACI|nr:glycosyltransferase family 4 protein [Alkalibacillus filiformis]MDQ0352778.1 glycosyltransferase involved in cell wall biosynthesis [Alkalibacillus filiformis]
MRILIATIFNYPHEGGLSTHMTTLKKGLETRGHTVDIISGSDFSKRDTTSIRGRSFIVNKFRKGKGQLLGDQLRMNLLKNLINNESSQYDVINTQDVFATLACKEMGIKIVETVHGYYTFEAISRGAYKENSKSAIKAKEIERDAYQSADDIICVDQRIKDYIKKEVSIEGNVIRNFIDLELFNTSQEQIENTFTKYNISNNKKILLVPRRLTEKNGVILPSLALPTILEEHPHVQLVYAGSGELLERLKNKVKELNIESNVMFLGSVPHHDMRSLFQGCDVVIVPSIHSKGVEEATSIAALEGMAAKKPVIAGGVGGLKEMINHSDNGMLFENENYNELAEHINILLRDSNLYNQIASSSYRYIKKNHALDTATAHFEQIYVQASEKK